MTRLPLNLTWLLLFSAAVVLGAFFTFVSGILFDDSYEITVAFPEAGGVLPDQQVTVLGRPVGQVSDVELTAEGVLLTLSIDGEQQVPDDSRVIVLRRSPIGEQAVDFQPLETPWTPVEEGARVDAAETVTPSKVPFLLERAKDLFQAIDLEDFGTVVDELATALEGRGPTLKQLGRETLDLNETLVEGIPDFERLIDTSEAVLDTLDEHRVELAQSFTNTADFTEVLADNRDTIERLLDVGAPALRELDTLVRNSRANLSCLVDDVHAVNAALLEPDDRAQGGHARGLVTDNYDTYLDALETGLEKANFFFTGFDIGTQWDPDTGTIWARIRFTDDPGGGQPYEPRRPTPATRPGAACQSPFGTGVQAIGAPGAVQDRTDASTFLPPDPTAPPIDWAPVVERSGDEPAAAPPPDEDRPPTPATGGGAALLVPLLAIGTALWLRRRQ